MTFIKDKQGLYFQGKLIANNYTDAIRSLFQLNQIPAGFCVDEDYKATGYSVVDSNGVQHIYELAPRKFYEELQKLK